MACYLITAFFSRACSPNLEVINHSTKICVPCLTCVFVGVRVASESVNSCVKFPLKYIVVDMLVPEPGKSIILAALVYF